MSTRRQYLLNIAWSWISAIALILNGMLVTPFLVRRLGEEMYGVWTVGLSLIEYFWLIDLGIRPATVKLTAHYRAHQDWDFVNSIISTAVSYSSAMGLVLIPLLSLNAGNITRFLHIKDPSFPLLIHVISISWGFGLVFNTFEATLEGFQRFDLTGRIFVCFGVIRSVALVTVVSLGYGLREMSIALLASQLLMYLSFLISLRKIYPELRISPWLATKKAGLEIFAYARQIFSSILSGRLISAAVPSLITRLVSVKSVTYFVVTQRVLDYAGEGVGRIGNITTPRAAELTAKGQRSQLVRLAEYGNKYCLMLWLLVGTWLFVYGNPLFRLWIRPEFGDHTKIILPCLLLGYTFWFGQFISSSVLMGVGEYTEYSNSLLIEAILLAGGLVVILPRYGVDGGAVWAALLIFLNRFVNLARIFTRQFQIPIVSFVWRCYRAPMSIAVVDIALLWIVKHHWLPGNSWTQLIVTGVCNTIFLAGAALWLVADHEHRASGFEAARSKYLSLSRRGLIAAQPPAPFSDPGGPSEV